MKKGFLVLLLVLATNAIALPLNEQEIFIRYCEFRYNLIDEAVVLLRAQLRLENGRRGSEAGLNTITPTSYDHPGDPQAYSDYGPLGSEQHVRLTRRILKDLQKFILNDPKLRRRFLIRYAANYLRGGLKAKNDEERGAANWQYFESLDKISAEERERRKHDGGYDPFRSRCD